jgi:hypothetical protein
MGFDVANVEGLLVGILGFPSSALIISAWTREGGTDVVDGIVHKTEDISWQEVDAWDNCHRAINQLVLRIALDKLLNGTIKLKEVIYEVCQPLMANDVVVPLVEILQHPQIGVNSPILVSSKVGVNNLHLCHPCGHLAETV